MRIVIVVADSLRADAVGAYGGGADTPTLDRIAAEGTRFDTVFSSSPWTLPSLAAMLTGCHGHRVGLVNWLQAWPAGFPTVFDHLAAAGWECASFVFDPRYLFTGLHAAGVLGSSRDEDPMWTFLRSRPARDQVVFVHHWGTHIPYVAGAMPWDAWQPACDALISLAGAGGAQRAKVRELYRRAVRRFSEEWLPRLLGCLDEAGGETALLVTADHGETWGERLRPGARLAGVFDLHGNALFDESLRVPLVLRGAGVPAGRVVAGLARSVDIAPTVLELAGVDAPAAVDGISLLGAAATGSRAPAARVVAACNRTVAEMVALSPAEPGPRDAWHRFAMRTIDRKWIVDDRQARQAFDLHADPGETSPLDGAAPGWENGWLALETEVARAGLVPIPGDVLDEERRKAEAVRRGVVRR